MGCCKTKVVIAGSTIALLAQVQTPDDVLLTVADVDSIRVDLNDITDENAIYPADNDGDEIVSSDDTGDPVPFDEPEAADVVLDTPLTNRNWSDSVGYNVEYKIAMPLRDHQYEVRMTITLTSGDTIVIRWPDATGAISAR